MVALPRLTEIGNASAPVQDPAPLPSRKPGSGFIVEGGGPLTALGGTGAMMNGLVRSNAGGVLSIAVCGQGKAVQSMGQVWGPL